MNVKNHKSVLKHPTSIAIVHKYLSSGILMCKTCITFNTGETEFRHMSQTDYVKYQKWVLGPRKLWDGSL